MYIALKLGVFIYLFVCLLAYLFVSDHTAAEVTGGGDSSDVSAENRIRIL